ncbi:MAG: DUF447 family protein [Methanomicrobiales archaeon]|nr:DUF447 family protein [Methanomicrobiales archaeon]
MGVTLSAGINEVIATTRNNAAPMGIIARDRLSMVVFRASHTAANLEREGWLVANFCHDPLLYVRTAFEDLPEEEFLAFDVRGTAMQRLREAEGYIAFAASVVNRTEDRLFVLLEPLQDEVLQHRLHPVNRGFNSVVEAAIHATRYVRNGDPRLRVLIDHHAGLIRRCGGPREWEALRLLEGYLERGQS